MREVSLNPPSMVDSVGRPLSASFIPFCAYQSNILGAFTPDLPFKSCSLSQPTVLDGQLCFTLDVNKIANEKASNGRKNGLVMLLDYGPTKLIGAQNSLDSDMDSTNIDIEMSNEDKTSARVFVQTLSRFSGYGEGSYAMSALKKMGGTKNFLEFPDEMKKCQVEVLEECNYYKYFERVQEECGCVPWGLDKLAAVDSGVSGMSLTPLPRCPTVVLGSSSVSPRHQKVPTAAWSPVMASMRIFSTPKKLLRKTI